MIEVVGAQALVGSSNFTRPGLTKNVELNVQIQSAREVAQLQEWFETHYYQKIVVAMNETIPIMGEIDEIIDADGGETEVLPEQNEPSRRSQGGLNARAIHQDPGTTREPEQLPRRGPERHDAASYGSWASGSTPRPGARVR